MAKNKTAKHGDIVRVRHFWYAHYGIYAETPDGVRIIHYTGENGPQDFNGMIRETPISVFLNGAKRYGVCELNPKDFKKIYSAEETVERARSKLGECGYNPLWNNCEHFAVWCKTGEAKCSQIRDLWQSFPSNMLFFLEEMLSSRESR